MNVILINGSSREKECTYTALSECANILNEEGIKTQIIHVESINMANDPGFIRKVSTLIEEADGLIVGSPVYYAAPNSVLTLFLTNLFSAMDKSKLIMMPAAAVTSARRAGTVSTLDQINKFFSFFQMPIVSSSYWPMLHGLNAKEAQKDFEGLQIMRVLSRNMAYMIKAFTLAKLEKPEQEKKIRTNFIIN
jgi:multimeric flavodoxin WrbA